ncbi:MAG: hypothetical protein PHT12_05765 [Patescibacteria group bacterium]|nr:hypothetical protein [Patescibacteria group bacterium]
MLIETSKDLFFVVLAFCILWLTIFLSWLLYYLIAILRDTESLMRRVRDLVEGVHRLANVMHEKVERSAASFTLVAQAVKEIVGWAVRERAAKRATTRRKAKADEEAADEE